MRFIFIHILEYIIKEETKQNWKKEKIYFMRNCLADSITDATLYLYHHRSTELNNEIRNEKHRKLSALIFFFFSFLIVALAIAADDVFFSFFFSFKFFCSFSFDHAFWILRVPSFFSRFIFYSFFFSEYRKKIK